MNYHILIFQDPDFVHDPDFVQALKKLDLLAKNTVVIGDDIETDIEGALNANIRGILVKTGKGQFYQPSKARIKPDLIIESFTSILEHL